jgi:hypothetical protein
MTAVANATGVFATLGYNFSDPNGNVKTFSANTQNQLTQFPAIIKSWQAQDIASSSVGGYFQNPVATATNTIITNSNLIYIAANNASNTNSSTQFANQGGVFMAMANAASLLYSTSSGFLTHTNKCSGVTSPSGQSDTNINPYYTFATAYGKQVMYITNQTDGIINSAPILGSLTSILIAPQVSANATTISNDYITLSNGISGNNISNAQITQITTDLTNINNYLSGRQAADVTFYQNMLALVNNYNITKQFTNMGETETYLCNNVVGTSKLITRINS